MARTTLIANGTLIIPQGQHVADVAVNGETIVAVGQGLAGDEVIDASGLLVLPGAIDPHVHLAMPAGDFRTSDDWRSGTIAAACGGTTTVIDFVEPEGQGLLNALAARRAEAAGAAVVDYALHMTLPDAQTATLAEIPHVIAAGVPSFKMYMTYAGLKLDDAALLGAAGHVAQAGGLALVHAENDAIIAHESARLLASGMTGPASHPLSRPSAAEGEAVERALALAEVAGCPIYIVHISTRRGAEAVKRARQRGQLAWGETCPQYLVLTDAEYQRAGFEGAKFVCSPPLRTSEDRGALWAALRSGDIATAGTDHCAFNFAGQKDRGDPAAPPPFNRIPGGVPGIESRLALLYAIGIEGGLISPQRWVDACCAKPAEIFGLARKGRIAPGFDADIVLFDPGKKHTISTATLHENCDYTPFEGLELPGYPVLTMLRGRVIARDGEYLGGSGGGRFVSRSFLQSPQL